MNARPTRAAWLVFLCACGSRTGLPGGEDFSDSLDASVADATQEAAFDAEAGPDGADIAVPDAEDVRTEPPPPVDLCKGVFCTAQSICHAVGVCDPSTGRCSQPTKPDGTSCNDGNPNTVEDQCIAGVCRGEDRCLTTSCVAKSDCHLPGVCIDHATGKCTEPTKPNGSSCDDGNPETVKDSCTGGVCEGINLCRGVLCQAADVCNFAGVCDFATGQCNQSPRPDGTACDDGNKKTIDDVCQAGVCKGVPACPTSTLVYVLSDNSELYSFYPPTLTFRRIGTLSCTDAATPYSMAVGRDGIGYSVFSNGELFQVDTRTAACSSTPYAPGQQGFTTFGMGYTADTDPTKDALYVIEGPLSGGQSFSKGLGRIRTDTMELDFIGAFAPNQFPGELTGSADGKLYGMHHDRTGSGHFLTEIEPASGNVLSSTKLQVGSRFSALAFSYWGGVFWVFTSDRNASGSTITRYDPATKVETNMGVAPAVLVGAGVSPCND